MPRSRSVVSFVAAAILFGVFLSWACLPLASGTPPVYGTEGVLPRNEAGDPFVLNIIFIN